MSVPSWEASGSSKTLHLIPPDQPRRKSGARSLCGRYPQKNDHAWFSLTRGEMPNVPPYGLTKCTECEEVSSS